MYIFKFDFLYILILSLTLVEENHKLKEEKADKEFETSMKLRNMQNQLKKYEKYIKKIPKEILDEIDAKEREKGKEIER